MQLKIRSVICWLLVVIFILVQGLNALSDIDGGEINEPQLYDNLDGNWTAVWEFVNPANYSLSNIDISDGKATLHLSEVAFIEDSPAEFRNGTSENLLLLQGNKAGLGLDLRRNSYTLIADAMNNRIVEIDYDKWVWQYGSNTTSGYGLNELSKPTFALRIHGNRTLITDTDNNRVLDVGRDHQFYWQYGSNSTSGIKENELNKPSSAVPMSNGNILIADTHNNYVLEVTRNNQRVWQYGYLNMSDPKDSDLNTPRYAEELPNGNILIADTGNHRVIEVTKQTKTIVWQYGTGLPGWKTGKLDSPTFAKRSGSSTSATTLIADMNNHRVIEVGNSGTILWQYGTTDVPGNDTNMLALPTCAIPLPNSKTLITDTGNHRVIEVTRAKDIVWQYGTNCSSGYGLNYLEYPRSGVRIKKNLLVGTFLSQVLDGGQLTNWTTIKWTKNLPANTMILIFSRTGNQPNPDLGLWSDWSDEYLNSTGEDITSPLNKYIQYAAVLFTLDLNETPILKSVTIDGYSYEQSGELVTDFFAPVGLLKWNSYDHNVDFFDQVIDGYYTIGETIPWHELPGDGNMQNVPTSTGKIKFKFVFSTSDISITPIAENFSLTYEALGELNSIKVIPERSEVKVGDHLSFSAIGYDPYGRMIAIESAWSSTVGNMIDNLLEAQTTPTTGYVNASIAGITGSVEIEVLPGDLEQIIVKPSEIVVIAGDKQKFDAFGYDEYNNEVNIEPKPNWDTNVGRMEENTFIAQDFAGRGKVKAMVDEIVGKADVTIELNSSTHHPPEILGKVPDQRRIEDSSPWGLSLAPFEWDDEDPPEKLFWYVTEIDTSLYSVTGSYSKEDILTFIPKPNAYGNDEALLWLVDSDNMTTSQPFWVNISPVNDKPLIEKLPDISVHYDEPYKFDYSNYILDIETPDKDLSLTVLEPDNEKYTQVNGLNVTFNYPKNKFGESIMLTLMVSDGYEFSQEMFQLTITDNHVPILSKLFPELTLSEGESKENIFDLDDHFNDPDNDPLAFFYNAQNLAINVNNNNLVTISSTGSWFGTEIITFRALDPYGGMAEGNMKIRVLGVNNPPQILPIPDLFVHYDYDYNFNISKYINDPDNETHELDIWTLNTEHIRFEVSDSTLMILNYPESLVGQTFWVTLNVSDGIEMTWTQFQVHVTDNYPPILKKNLADVHFNEDTGLQHAINLLEYFDDEDDVGLDFSYNLVDEKNITIEFNPGNTVDFSSKKDWYGSSFISFRAEDSSNAFIDAGINIVVIPVNDPPAVNQIPNQTGKVGERWVLDLTPYLLDVDNNVSELEITCDNEFVIVTGKQLTFFGDKKANTEVEFIVSDGYLNSTGIISLNIAKSEQQKTQDVMQIIWFFLIIIALIIVGMLLAVVRRRRGNFIITDVFLIHQNGVLIKYLGDTLKKDSDEDIISGMLTAVQSFISDSFAGGAKDEADGWSLNQLRMGKHEIMFEHGKYIYITVIYKGNPGRRLSQVLSETVTKVEKDFGKALDSWSGNYAKLKGIGKIVAPLITIKKPATKPKKKVIPEIQMPLKSEKVDQELQPQPQTAQKTGSPILSMSQIAQLPPHQPQLTQSSSIQLVHQTSVELSKKLPKRSPPKSSDQPTQQYYAQIPTHISSQSSVQSNQVNKDRKL